LLARGFAGKDGHICMIDSESGRGSLYADVLPGGYKTLELTAPFSPARYIEAIDAVEKSGAVIGIIDSASHEWEGISGVLDMATKNEEQSGKPGLHNWRKPKMEHAKFMLRMLQSSIPWIVCLRAKYKSRQIKNDRGKTEIVKDDHTSPISAEDFIYEMTCHFEVMPDHTIHLTKASHPTLGECFPADYKEPVSIKTGEAIAAWAAGGGAKPRPQSSARPAASQYAGRTTVAPVTADDPLKAAKATLWNMVKHNFDKVAAFENYLLSEGKLDGSENLKDLPLDRILGITEFMKN
jgi:hypothetical protein